MASENKFGNAKIVPYHCETNSPYMKLTPYKLAKLQAEIKQIGEAIDKTDGKVGEAAKLLQIDRKTIYNKLKIYNKWLESQSKKKALSKAKAPQ